MCLDPVVSSDINRSCLEFCFHNPEILFNFPALFVNLYDFFAVSLEICHNRIKTIVKFFFGDLLLVKLIHFLFSNFTIVCQSSFFHKTHRIILIFSLSFFARRVDDSLCTLDLPCPDFLLISILFALQQDLRLIRLACHLYDTSV